MSIPLHYQIIFAMIIGAVVGIVFPIDENELLVTYDNGKKSELVEFFVFTEVHSSDNKIDTLNGNKSSILIPKLRKYFDSKSKINLKIYTSNESLYFNNVIDVSKTESMATYFSPLGNFFIKLLSFISIPLVLSTLIVGASSLGNVSKLGRIGGKTVVLYLSTTAIAITIGLFLANIFEPGNTINEVAKARLLNDFSPEVASKSIGHLEINFVDFIINIVPKNPFNAIANGEMLQIVFFALVIGLSLNFISSINAKPVIDFFEGLGESLISLTMVIMKFAPFGVFALIANTVAGLGFEILITLIWYSLIVLVGLIIHTYIVYPIIVKFIGGMKIREFFAGIKEAQIIGFSTSSSAATLPITYRCVENNLGVRKEISSFVLPLGATINMDGTALYQGVAAVFIAQVYGIDLTLADQLTILITAVLASIGTAPVPGVGLIMLIMILSSIHIPAEGIALIIGVDRILDMMRTVTNVSGDSAVAVAINNWEK